MANNKRFRDYDDDGYQDFRERRGRSRRGGRNSFQEPEPAYSPPLEIPAFKAAPPVEDTSTMERGIVKFFNAEKGFGFVAAENGGGDVFLHVTALRRAGIETLADGQAIHFEREPSSRQPGKFSVRRLSL